MKARVIALSALVLTISLNSLCEAGERDLKVVARDGFTLDAKLASPAEQTATKYVIVLIHGSGPSRRESGWYLTLTKYLQDNGVLVLLPDKRVLI